MNQRMIDAAARAAMQPTLQPQQPQGVGLTVGDILGMVNLNVLTPRQAFDLVFSGIKPENFIEQPPNKSATACDG